MSYTGLYVEDFQIGVDVETVRRTVGGRRKLRQLSEVEVSLADGRKIAVELMQSRSRFGDGRIVDFRCPACGRGSRVLRVAPGADGLLCTRCLTRKFRARYRSQEVRRYREDHPANQQEVSSCP